MPELSFLPFQNVYISEWYHDINFAGNRALFISQYKQAQDDYRSLIQFDLDPLFSSVIIKEAILELTMYRNESSEPTTITVHRLLHHWNQASVTWDTYPVFNQAAEGSVIINKDNVAGKVFIDVTELVKSWQKGSIPNHGLLLKGNEQANALLAFRNTNYSDDNSWPLLHVTFANEVNIDPEKLIIPKYPPYAPLEASTPVSLLPRKQATFLVKNASDSSQVRAIIQVGYSNNPDETFFDTGHWVDLKPKGYPGEAVALTTTDIAEYARVLVKGDGGETVYVWSRTREC